MSQETSDFSYQDNAVTDEKKVTPTTDSSSKGDGEMGVGIGSCSPFVDRAKESKMMRKFDVSSHVKKLHQSS